MLGPGEVGRRVRAVVIARNASGAERATSAPTAAVLPAPPAVLGPPTVAGTPRVGAVLAADPGTWTPAGVHLEGRWQRCAVTGAACVDIPGADTGALALTDADAGHAVVFRVVATNAGGRAEAASAPTAEVRGPGPRVLERPAIVGTARAGEDLLGTPGRLGRARADRARARVAAL